MSRQREVLPPRAKKTPDLLIAAALFLVFWALYAFSIGTGSPNLFWYNFIFDADPGRIVQDYFQGQNPGVYARHPLFTLVIGSLAGVLIPVTGPEGGVLAAVSGYAALGVGMAFLFFRRVCGALVPALCLAILYGLAASVWVLGSIPETFAINSTFVVALFLLHRPEFVQPVTRPFRFAAHALVSALGIGVSVPNVVYAGASVASNVWRTHPGLVRRAAILLGWLGSAGVILFLLSLAQQIVFPVTMGQRLVLSAPATAASTDPLLTGHPFRVGEVAGLARSFLADNVVAPPAQVEVVLTGEGALQMIQYGGGITPLYLVALIVFGGALLALLITAGKKPWREPTAQVALALLGYNLAFFYFYRANGQPFIFTIHSVFPLLVLLAHGYAASEFRFRRWLLLGAAGLAAANNIFFLSFVNRALASGCDRRLGNVCLAWETGAANDPRFIAGRAAFQESPEYPFELGRETLTVERTEEAIPHLRQALELNPNHRLARLALGYALVKANRLAEAITFLTESLQRDPDNSRLAALLAEARDKAARSPPQR